MKRSAVLNRFGTLAALLATSAPAHAQPLVTVRLGSIPDDGLTPVLYAVQSGIFKKLGLDVQVQTASSGAALAAAMVAGAVDIAKSSLMSMISAYAHGVKFKIIAGAAISSSARSVTELAVLNSSPITSLADANGKTVASSALRSFDQMATQALIDKRGGNSASLKFIELPYATMLAALEQGRADIVAITNPFLAAALQTGKIRTLGDPYEGVGERFLIAGWFCTEDYASRYPAIVQHFAVGLRQAAAYTNTHHEQTVALLSGYTHIDPSTVRGMSRINAPTAPIVVDEIQPVIDTAAKYGFIGESFAAKNLLPDIRL